MKETQDIVKALQDIAKSVENNASVTSVKVIITVTRQKPSKATTESK